jgi:hypothetical protein
MENTTDTKLPASPPLPAPTGSEQKSTIPTDMLRLVCQVEDTEGNRAALIECVKAIERIPFPTTPKLSVLKLEQVRLTLMKKLIPNH